MAQSSETQNALQQILDKSIDNKNVFGTSFAVKSDNFSWQGSSGNIALDQQFFIASTTKLFTSAMILMLRQQGKLSLDDKLSKYFSESLLSGIHTYRGKDYSQELTIKHLLAHTSGLPDYFQDKGSNGRSLEDDLVQGNDQYWSFEDAMKKTKSLKPHFPPGKKGKAHYSDANFQLLGKIIEVVTSKTYNDYCEETIIRPLGLTKTYMYVDSADTRPKTLYYKRNELRIPKGMTSFVADGSMLSNSTDLLIFIEAFFTGRLFPAEYISELQEWNRIFYPMKSGTGIHLFKLPWIFNPTGLIPYFIGHSGLSGALAFYVPEKKFFIAGTVNQVARPDLSFRTMIKLTRQLMKN